MKSERRENGLKSRFLSLREKADPMDYIYRAVGFGVGGLVCGVLALGLTKSANWLFPYLVGASLVLEGLMAGTLSLLLILAYVVKE